MAAYELKNNTGSAFKNDKDNIKWDYNGTLIVEGKHYFIDVYVNKSQAGNTYLKFALKEKSRQPGIELEVKDKTVKKVVADDGFEDDIPF